MQKINETAFSGAICSIVIMALVVLGCGRFGGQPKGGVGDLIREPVPSIDPAEPFPAISKSLIDTLITEVPELGKYRDEILNAERTAINGVLEDVRMNSRAAKGNVSDTTDESASLPGPASLRQTPSRYEPRKEGGQRTADFLGYLKSTQVALAAAPEASVFPRAAQAFVIGHQHAFFSPDYGKIKDSDRGQSRTVPIKDGVGTVLATTITSVSRTDSSVSNELSTKIYMPILELDSNSRVKLTGNQCPTSEGKLDLTVEYSSNGRAGSSGTIIYDKNISARIKASVNDDAELAGIDLDLKQATRSTAGGRQVYVETSQSGQGGTGNYEDIELGDLKIDRASSQATSADQSISDDGLQAAYRLGQGVLESAKGRWQGGGCVKIDAASPGSVAVNSTTQIPVKVVHKFDDADVPSKLEAALTGEALLDPTLIPKTAGTLTYTAPGETGKTATIKLSASSRRGRATLDLNANTGGGSYQIVGGLDDWQTNSEVCDVMKPFTLTGAVGITMELSGGLAGTYTYGGGPFNANGSGTYTISLPGGLGKPGTMTGSGAGEVTGDKVYTGTGTEKYTLTPIPPCE